MIRRILDDWLCTVADWAGMFAIALLALSFLSDLAYGRTCKDEPGSRRHYWSYRIVDHRRCWYHGRARNLYWPTRAKATASERDEVDVLLETVWPPLSDFDKRWMGE